MFGYGACVFLLCVSAGCYAQSFQPNIWTVDTGPTNSLNVSGMTFFHSPPNSEQSDSADQGFSAYTSFLAGQSKDVDDGPPIIQPDPNIGGSIYQSQPTFPSFDTPPLPIDTPSLSIDPPTLAGDTASLGASFTPFQNQPITTRITSVDSMAQGNPFVSSQLDKKKSKVASNLDLSKFGILENNISDNQIDNTLDNLIVGPSQQAPMEDKPFPFSQLDGGSDSGKKGPAMMTSKKFVDHSKLPVLRVKSKFVDTSNIQMPSATRKTAPLIKSPQVTTPPAINPTTKAQNMDVGSITNIQEAGTLYGTATNSASGADISSENDVMDSPNNGATIVATTTPKHVNHVDRLTVDALYPAVPFPVSNANNPVANSGDTAVTTGVLSTNTDMTATGGNDGTNSIGNQGQTSNFGNQGQTSNFGNQGQTSNFGNQGQTSNFGNQGQTSNIGNPGQINGNVNTIIDGSNGLTGTSAFPQNNVIQNNNAGGNVIQRDWQSSSNGISGQQNGPFGQNQNIQRTVSTNPNFGGGNVPVSPGHGFNQQSFNTKTSIGRDNQMTNGQGAGPSMPGQQNMANNVGDQTFANGNQMNSQIANANGQQFTNGRSPFQTSGVAGGVVGNAGIPQGANEQRVNANTLPTLNGQLTNANRQQTVINGQQITNTNNVNVPGSSVQQGNGNFIQARFGNQLNVNGQQVTNGQVGTFNQVANNRITSQTPGSGQTLMNDPRATLPGQQIKTNVPRSTFNGQQINTNVPQNTFNGQQINTNTSQNIFNGQQVNTNTSQNIFNGQQTNTQGAFLNGQQLTNVPQPMLNGRRMNTQFPQTVGTSNGQLRNSQGQIPNNLAIGTQGNRNTPQSRFNGQGPIPNGQQLTNNQRTPFNDIAIDSQSRFTGQATVGQGNAPNGQRMFGQSNIPNGQRSIGLGNIPNGQRNIVQGNFPNGQQNIGQGNVPNGQRNIGQDNFLNGQQNIGQGNFLNGQQNIGQGNVPNGQRNIGQGNVPNGQQNIGQGNVPNGQRNIGQGNVPNGQQNIGQGNVPNGQRNIGQGNFLNGQPNIGQNGQPNNGLGSNQRAILNGQQIDINDMQSMFNGAPTLRQGNVLGIGTNQIVRQLANIPPVNVNGQTNNLSQFTGNRQIANNNMPQTLPTGQQVFNDMTGTNGVNQQTRLTNQMPMVNGQPFVRGGQPQRPAGQQPNSKGPSFNNINGQLMPTGQRPLSNNLPTSGRQSINGQRVPGTIPSGVPQSSLNTNMLNSFNSQNTVNNGQLQNIDTGINSGLGVNTFPRNSQNAGNQNIIPGTAINQDRIESGVNPGPGINNRQFLPNVPSGNIPQNNGIPRSDFNNLQGNPNMNQPRPNPINTQGFPNSGAPQFGGSPNGVLNGPQFGGPPNGVPNGPQFGGPPMGVPNGPQSTFIANNNFRNVPNSVQNMMRTGNFFNNRGPDPFFMNRGAPNFSTNPRGMFPGPAFK